MARKLAIVDDEIQIVEMLKKFFEKGGKYSVVTFSDPISGLNYLGSNDVDLVLLDIMMPKMDGLELLAKLKEKKPHAKVVMMTAFSTLDRVLKSHKEGADNYIMKPFESLAELERKVSEAIEK